MGGVPIGNWKQHIFNGISEKKTDSPKLSAVKNATFTFDLTQIQVVSFQCNQFLI